MMGTTGTGRDDDQATSQVVAELQHQLGGRVTGIRRQARWRPAWFAQVEGVDGTSDLYVRGERTDMRPIFSLRHEQTMQEQLDRHDIPVPRVRAFLEHPAAIVMDQLSGSTDFSGSDEIDRRSVMDDYLRILASMHRLDIGPFVRHGAQPPYRPIDAALTGIRAYERAYRLEKVRPDPFMEFCLAWLKRNPPRHHVRPSVVVWDSGQFLHEAGKVTAVLDLELAHIGDPLMDLAGLRMRGTVIDYGDILELYSRYEQMAGVEVDLAGVEYHHFAFALTTQLAYHRALAFPTTESDLMNYLQWCSESNLFAVEALAGFTGIDLDPVGTPAPRVSASAPAHRHLMDSIRSLEGGDEQEDYELRIAFRLARHLRRCDEIGEQVTEGNLDDLAGLLGRRPETWEDGERRLEEFVLASDQNGDEDLVRLFHRRLERQRMLLGPPGSAIATHLALQPIR
jgi:aminoglycoside phosphotransferase (APT) family kinase protein